MWLFSEAELNCVRTAMSRKPELIAFESGTSMSRCLPAERNGRLGPVAGEGVEALSLASAEDDGVDAALRHFSHG